VHTILVRAVEAPPRFTRAGPSRASDRGRPPTGT
jgi:hypothetical protein